MSDAKHTLRPRSRPAAFTLVELLVVVSIITLLVAMLMPAMEEAVAHARLAKCLTQERGISIAIGYYMNNNQGRLYNNRNRHRWHPGTSGSVDQSKYIAYTNGAAYWGGAYRTFGAPKVMFNCPDATASQADYDLQFTAEQWSDGSWAAGHIYTTYGFNGIFEPWISQANPGFPNPFYESNGVSVKNTTWPAPATTVMFLDTYESNMEGGGDAPYKFNQSEWMSVPAAKAQNYRHLRGAAMGWADGSASHHKPAYGFEPGRIDGDFPIRWFSAGEKVK